MNSREHNIPNSRMPGPTKLQVLICTYGADGIARTARSRHPSINDVEYLISWQTDGNTPLPEELLRDDIKVYPTPTRGLSVNRNHALVRATAPLLLVSDDDVDYTEGQLHTVIESFSANQDCDLLAFEYESEAGGKTYPGESFSLDNPAKGYFPTSFELAFRKNSVQGKIWFNENFGIGATFPSGEEDVFIRDCINAGLTGRFIPKIIARHDGITTGQRNLLSADRPKTKGAVFLHIHPYDWPLRLAAHAIREIPLWMKGITPPPLSYIRNWLKGASAAKRLKVFPTPDYSDKYIRDDG